MELEDEVGVTTGFVCPLGLCTMRDPVTAADGVSYERVHIERHIQCCQVCTPFDSFSSVAPVVQVGCAGKYRMLALAAQRRVVMAHADSQLPSMSRPRVSRSFVLAYLGTSQISH